MRRADMDASPLARVQAGVVGDDGVPCTTLRKRTAGALNRDRQQPLESAIRQGSDAASVMGFDALESQCIDKLGRFDGSQHT